jgi:rare lipoprotein A (peptidoglycan hydrolase)
MLEDRILDLSRAAAQRIGLRGIGRVRIERLKSEDPQVAVALTQMDLVAKNNLQTQFPFLAKR